MSDVLSPAEQARAARWAADWLNDAGWMSQFAAASGAVDALKRHSDEMDPPETVESLRAERDAVAERAERESHALAVALDAMRAERDEAWRSALNLKAELDEREDVAAEREPRVWRAGDDQPEGVTQVRDVDGARWFNNNGAWTVEGDGRTWARIARNYAPLTEVLSED